MTEYKSKVKYEAPIEMNIEEDFPDYGSMAVSEIENMICSAVLKVGITVEKEELIKALRYDRGQYEKGYADGKRDAAPRWHRVEDGLPPKATWVLTVAKDGDALVYSIATVDAGGTWWTIAPQSLLREQNGVRYWMPIEPPKEDA